MLIYAQWAPTETVDQVERHVRDHLSSIASATDSQFSYDEEVQITRTEEDGGILVTGRLDRPAAAPYLDEGWTPAGDRVANPLTVTPIGGNP